MKNVIKKNILKYTLEGRKLKVSLIIKPKRLQIRAMVGGKWQTVELVKANSKTVLVKLGDGNIVKIKNFKISN